MNIFMSERNQEHLELPGSVDPVENDATEQGFLHSEENSASATMSTPPATSMVLPDARQAVSAQLRVDSHVGTVEHLAARRALPAIDLTAAATKQQLSELRAEVTDLLTELRWGGRSVTEVAERIIPLLNLGPVPQWKSVLIPFLLEIDRAGNLIPVWLKIIEQEEPQDLPADANPAETEIGRARRYAIMMLGNYKYASIEGNTFQLPSLTHLLGALSRDPKTSLYATQALVKQGTTMAIQMLLEALKDAEGWAKVDIIEACIALNLTRFYDLLLASGLDKVSGLESYVAVPLYRVIQLEPYLRQDVKGSPRLAQQAALVFAQVLQDSIHPPKNAADPLPIVFERPLPALAQALFDGARKQPTWQHALAMHRLGSFLGRYWSEISRGALQDPRIVEPVYACLPLMPEVERWMNGPGREVLLEALSRESEPPLSVVRALGDLRDPRAVIPLLARLEQVRTVTEREQARYVGVLCDTLGRLADQRVVGPMLQLLNRSVAVERRANLPKRRDSLPLSDADVAGSIIYGSVVRACGLLGESSTLELALRAASDFDPYVRLQAVEAIKRLDPSGTDPRSLLTARDLLNDPNDAVVRMAIALIVQYRDRDSVSMLRHLIEARPQLAPVAYDALRQLEHY
jgi:HEAT repeat protein